MGLFKTAKKKAGPVATRLHGSSKSSTTQRIRLALAIKKVNYSMVEVSAESNNDDGFLSNPSFLGQTPVLEIDGLVLSQTMAILEYLEDSRPMPPLLPAKPHERAPVRMLCEVINSGMQPLHAKGVLRKIARDYSDDKVTALLHGKTVPDDGKQTWPQHWSERGFQAVETILDEARGYYCFGGSITMADLMLVPELQQAMEEYGVTLAGYPQISRVHKNFLKHPELAVIMDPEFVPSHKTADFGTLNWHSGMPLRIS